MAEHTPGPWHLVEKQLVWWVMPPIGEPVQILSKHGSVTTQDRSHEEVLANATLTAAAPELLAACRGLIDALESMMAIDHPQLHGDVAVARAAIAKAEGTVANG